jgi:hypothetical protein
MSAICRPVAPEFTAHDVSGAVGVAGTLHGFGDEVAGRVLRVGVDGILEVEHDRVRTEKAEPRALSIMF